MTTAPTTHPPAARDHADVGGRPTRAGVPPLPPQPWPHDRQPTSSEWVEWFLTMSGRQREYIAKITLDMARRGTACATGMHEERLEADTLTTAQIAVQAHLDDTDGISCPCCGQLAKRYRRKINSQMAAALIKMFRTTNKWEQRGILDADPVELADLERNDGVLVDHGQVYVHLPTLLGKTADEAKLHYWGLIDPLFAIRADGSTRTGWWTITDRGREYVRDDLALTKYALIFDGKLTGYDGPLETIHDALGTRFNYTELMEGR